MSDKPVVLESAEYRAEEDRLVEDPIIVAMSKDPALDGVDLESHEFMMAASRYYNQARREAGTDRGEFGSIGGPARSIRRLRREQGVS